MCFQPLVPALQPSMEAFGMWFGMATDTLVRGRPERGARRQRVRAAIGHALSFTTWRSLVQEQGLSRDDAVDLMTALVAAAT